MCPDTAVPRGMARESSWSLIKLHGPFPLTAVGLLASIAIPLAAAGISIFAISTFDTDYILVREKTLEKAIEVITSGGHRVVGRVKNPRSLNSEAGKP